MLLVEVPFNLHQLLGQECQTFSHDRPSKGSELEFILWEKSELVSVIPVGAKQSNKLRPINSVILVNSDLRIHDPGSCLWSIIGGRGKKKKKA